MNLEEKKLRSEHIFEGRVVDLWRDEVELPNGNTGVREVVRHVGAVSILPIDSEGRVICVRQYRYPFAEILLEVPAGKLDSKSEDVVEAALRELREETGALCENLISLGKLIPSCAVCDEVINMFVATGLSFGETQPDDDEFLDVVRVPLDELVDMVMEGKIRDAKTQTSVLKVQRLIDTGKLKIK